MSAGTARTRMGASARIATLVVAIVAAGAVVAVPTATAVTLIPVYKNIPGPLPGDLPSWGFEGTSTSEYGGQVQLDPGARRNPRVIVAMSSRACQAGHWDTGDCVTAPGQTFTHDVTLKIYAVNPDNSPGTLLASQTKTSTIPYRPAADPVNCTGADAGKWFSNGTCVDGQAFRIAFPRPSVVVPDKVILAIAFNTTHSGSSPIGEGATCFLLPPGCGYDYLGVGLNYPPRKGTDPLPDDAYLNSSDGASYCDGGVGGTGTFRLDAGCWTGKQLAINVRVRA
jgi:hypothetical protein